ncbi:plant expansin-like protein [Tuber magnatum]|uniref:Plant expansin-like protein n=1 Tax=Tuber magnatum TaxID=42249 RepID=A0A317SNM6_9PEZI|nr:plant expansin-like protein [Tuber magnatum]
MRSLFPWGPRCPDRAPHDDSLPPFPDRVLDESSQPPVFLIPRRPAAAALKGLASDSKSAESTEKELPAPPARPKFYGIALPGWMGLRKERNKDTITPPTSGALQTGDGTYYEPGLGACGIVSTSSESIVAVSHIIFDAAQVGPNPNTNPLCGRKIWVTREAAPGKNVSMEVEVVDRCTGCKAPDLDFSLSVFEQLADEQQGRVLVSWAWVV